MLSRTADSLFWFARYLERADFQARLLETGMRLSSLPSTSGPGNEWESAITASGGMALFSQLHDAADEDSARHFIIFSKDNPSSIRNCIAVARANARSVRAALTSEVWEAINEAWLELRAMGEGDMNREETLRFLDWVKRVPRAVEGAAHHTMLRNDAYWFMQLGEAIERADNTARILDVKYHLLLPSTERVGGSLDYFQWAAILRQVSALTAYHWVYRESVRPWLVADLLILNRQMPRSLASCYGRIVHTLDDIAEAYGQHGPGQDQAAAILARLEGLRIADIFQLGLHEFITGFIQDNNRLGATLSQQYLLS
ncbi:alpha-E domain-containing protein [Camelimonas abortus]|uniref:Alpha-E domain-containing protein n=1 Tax=Camelimonas abortus TaxID=1017184 RepID=A0ABV7LB92_9HYPH